MYPVLRRLLSHLSLHRKVSFDCLRGGLGFWCSVPAAWLVPSLGACCGCSWLDGGCFWAFPLSCLPRKMSMALVCFLITRLRKAEICMNGGFSVVGDGGGVDSGSACSQYLVSLVSVSVSGCMSTNNPVPPRQIVQRSSEVYTILYVSKYGIYVRLYGVAGWPVALCVPNYPRFPRYKGIGHRV